MGGGHFANGVERLQLEKRCTFVFKNGVQLAVHMLYCTHSGELCLFVFPVPASWFLT